MASGPANAPVGAILSCGSRKAGTGTTRYAESFDFAQDRPGVSPASPRFPRSQRLFYRSGETPDLRIVIV
jgi:hypothetical protein